MEGEQKYNGGRKSKSGDIPWKRQMPNRLDSRRQDTKGRELENHKNDDGRNQRGES